MSDAGQAPAVTVEAIRELLLECAGISLDEGRWSGVERLQEVVAMDSVALLEFVVALERRFGVTIGEDWLSVERLGDLTALTQHIRERVAAR
jgi:acyl carrier protein